VQAIIRELRGEKIDIVEWSEDPVLFVTNALSPAKVQRVTIVDEEERVMEVVVEDRQLSLAIGKKGQNVRLAAKLTGWRIDIKSEEEKRKEVELQFEGFETPDGEDAGGGGGVLILPDIHDEVVGVLRSAGYQSAAQVAAADPTVLMECGLDEETVQAVIESARAVVEADQAEAALEPEAAQELEAAQEPEPAEPGTDTQSHS
jgi:transcription termination/antitermination protein NusA